MFRSKKVKREPIQKLKRRRQFSIRYKFLIALMSILLSALTVFFYFSYKTFREDKVRFVTDLNLTVLKSVSNELEADFRRRIYEIQSLIPILYDRYRGTDRDRSNPFDLLSPDLKNEVMSVTFYKKDNRANFIVKDGYTYFLKQELKRLIKVRDYVNFDMLNRNQLPSYLISEVNKQHPIEEGHLQDKLQIAWVNRSIRVQKDNQSWEVPTLTMIFHAKMVGGSEDTFIIAVDLHQGFLQKKLQEADLAEMFLIQEDGRLISHGDLDTTLDFADRFYDHPLLSRFHDANSLPRESLEIRWEGKKYLATFGATGFGNVFLVSQIPKEAAFSALNLLVRNFAFLAMAIVCVAVIVTVLLAGKLTVQIGRLQNAAERVGRGELDLKMDIKSNDEIQRVGETMEWMSRRISVLLDESAERARMKGELETAQLVQSTLLSNPSMSDDAIEVTSYYAPASECGGDFIDVFRTGSKVILLVGDATGHGVSAALLTAVAKSFSSTLQSLQNGDLGASLSPSEMMSMMNKVIYQSCRGQLLMTVALVELDTVTGKIRMANGGHESPMRLVKEELVMSEDKPSLRKSCLPLFARGERLGFSPDSKYETTEFGMEDGDIVLLYTDGITEAVNQEEKEWGERSLKRTLVTSGLRSLTEIKMELAEAVTAHRGDAAQKDDISFILVKWKKRLAKAA